MRCIAITFCDLNLVIRTVHELCSCTMALHCVCHSSDTSGKIHNPLQSTIVISTSFFFVFSAFMSIQALQNSLNMEEGLGVKSLACLYSTSIVSSVLAPTVIKVLGGKLTTIAAFSCHTVYTLTNFYPTFYTLIPSSLLLGLATGPLWTSQNLYIAASATRISQKNNKELIYILNKHNGIFYSLMGIAFASGSIVSSVIFRHDLITETNNSTQFCGVQVCTEANLFNFTQNIPISKPSSDLLIQLFSVYLAFDIIGIIITALFLPTLPVSDWTQKTSAVKSIYSMFSAMIDIKMILFLPLAFTVGLLRFVLYADYTRAYVTCPFGVGMVGYVMASFSLTNTIFLQIVPRVAKYVRRQILVALATVIIIVEMILWLIWNPLYDQLPLVFLSSIVWGIADSVLRLETVGVIPLIFPENKEPAFANVHFWNGLMATVYFASASYLCVFTKLVICIATLLVSTALYSVLEVIKGRESKEKQVVQKLKVDEEENLKPSET